VLLFGPGRKLKWVKALSPVMSRPTMRVCGERKGADPVEPGHRRQPALLLLLGAELEDGPHGQSGLTGHALVAQGVVTEQELDSVVTSSIGLRWAVAGPWVTASVSGVVATLIL
jgi:hypothetical protein